MVSRLSQASRWRACIVRPAFYSARLRHIPKWNALDSDKRPDFLCVYGISVGPGRYLPIGLRPGTELDIIAPAAGGQNVCGFPSRLTAVLILPRFDATSS
jgi:hypothetical protein